MTNNLEAALREALTNARTWFSQIADNASDPSEPVADNGATVWDAVRDFCVQRARDIDAALSAASGDRAKLKGDPDVDDYIRKGREKQARIVKGLHDYPTEGGSPAPSEVPKVEQAHENEIARPRAVAVNALDDAIADARAEGIAAERERCEAIALRYENSAHNVTNTCRAIAAAIREARP